MIEPLIYTSRGNLPIADLTYSTHWQDTGDAVTLAEEYRDSDGEIVRRSVHVLKRAGDAAGIQQGAING